MKKILISLTIFLLLLNIGNQAFAKKVFPNAVGWGTDWSMADSGGTPTICIVTSTGTGTGIGDSTRNGVAVKEGTLRSCIDYDSGSNGKYILFETSGVIVGDDPYSYSIDNSYTQIWGETAPSPGITLRNLRLNVDASNVLVRHIRSRIGDASSGLTPDNRTNFSATTDDGDIDSVVWDHITSTWGVDINSLWAWEDQNAHPGNNATNITVTNCLIYEGLDESMHSKTIGTPYEGHSKGNSFNCYDATPYDQDTGVQNVFYAKNINALNVDRSPYWVNAKGIISNNLNFGGDVTLEVPSPIDGYGHYFTLDMTYNFIINSSRDEFMSLKDILSSSSSAYLLGNTVDNEGTDEDFTQSGVSDWGGYDNEQTGVRIWGTWTGDACDTNTSGTIDSQTEWACAKALIYSSTPNYTLAGWSPETNLDTLKAKLISTNKNEGAGARPWDRDYEDQRIIDYIDDEIGTGLYVPDSITWDNSDCTAADAPIGCCTGSGTGTCQQNTSAGWGNLATTTNTTTLNIPSTGHSDTNGDGWTDVEEWIFGFTGYSAPAKRIWPGLYGHGTEWSINDAPGTGLPRLYIINSLDDNAASGTSIGNFQGTGMTAWVGNFRYCLEAANEDASGNPNGKIVILGINGTLNNNNSPWIWYVTNNDYTMMDFNPPATGIDDGLLLRNIKLASPETADPPSHLFIKDLRSFHGSGANGLDGGTNNTAISFNNRKPASLGGVDYLVIYKSTLIWAVDGPLGVGGERYTNDVDYVTVADSIIGGGIAYGYSTTWSPTGSYADWQIVKYDSPVYEMRYYESTVNNNYGHDPYLTSDLGGKQKDCNGDYCWRMISTAHCNIDSGSWKALTSECIDHFSVVRNLFYASAQRTPLFANHGYANADNNILYNNRELAMTVTNAFSSPSGLEDYNKYSITKNLIIGGPNSSTYTDEYFPSFRHGRATTNDNTTDYVSWYGDILYSNENAMTSITNTSFRDLSSPWGSEDLTGHQVWIYGGTGVGRGYRTITSNTTTQINIDETWPTINPDSTSDYYIMDMSAYDIYIAYNRIIECTNSADCTDSPVVRDQAADLTNPYDWDYVDNRWSIGEGQVRHTTAPTGSVPTGWSPALATTLETSLLATDGTGIGAYNSNPDTVTLGIINDVKNRTNTYTSLITSVEGTDYPTITATGPLTGSTGNMGLPTDWWDLCTDGNYRLVYWLQHEGSMTGCDAPVVDPDPPEPGEPEITAFGIMYNASGVDTQYDSDGASINR